MVLGVLFVDLDRFKQINDTLGHRVGDEVLKVVASRLRDAVNESDVVVRAGGDEFVIVVRSAHSAEEVATLAQRLLGRVAEPIVVGDRQFFISASIGGALSPDHGVSADELVTNADTAMYRAKREGAGEFMFFDGTMHSAGIESVALEADLRSAVSGNQMRVLYQPVVDLQAGNIVGCEALVRWHHPEHGDLLPAAFLRLAEQNGTIVELTRLVVRRACAVLARMRERYPAFRMAVNLSPRDLRDDDIVSTIAEELLRARLAPDAFEIEVTENAALDDHSVATLQTFRELGVRIALDDFGVAYNSLSYVKRLPVTSLKIHESFVRDIDTSRYDQAIVRAILSLGDALDLRIVAEGVESASQLQVLRSLGCAHAQGYRFSYPLEEHDLEALLAAPPDYAKIGRSA
jgi:diguanylate cyclase (GGDEF)-like protein